MGQLYGWMRQLPVIGFNSGQYDLNVVKQFLVPYFLATLQRQRNKKKKKKKTTEREQEEEKKEEERWRRTFFRHQAQQRFHVSFDGSVEIPRHDQLPSSRVQLRQVSESVRM